jgi:quercetin dioxygenase-like cupin family protein
MSKAGDLFQNPLTGETAIVSIGTDESGGELLIADLYIAPGGAVMGEHYHPAIEERLTLIHGELAIRLSGRATKAMPGVTLLVPHGFRTNTGTRGMRRRSFELRFDRLLGLKP